MKFNSPSIVYLYIPIGFYQIFYIILDHFTHFNYERIRDNEPNTIKYFFNFDPFKRPLEGFKWIQSWDHKNVEWSSLDKHGQFVIH